MLWQLKIKDVTSTNVPAITLNKDSDGKLEYVNHTDSIVTVSLKFKQLSYLNNLIVVNEEKKPLGIITRRVFSEQIKNKKTFSIDSYDEPIIEHRKHFNLVAPNSIIEQFKIDYNKTLLDVLIYFTEKKRLEHFYEDDVEVYPESAIVVDDKNKVYSIISYKDILKLLLSDNSINKTPLIDILAYKLKSGDDVQMLTTHKSFLGIDLSSTYSVVYKKFMQGIRTLPIINDNKIFYGWMVNYIGIPTDRLNEKIDDRYIYHVNSFIDILVNSSEDTFENLISKFRTPPFFSSLPIVTKTTNNNYQLVSMVSYTNIFKWALECLTSNIKKDDDE